jgi:sporulation integral membrane protein YtvI
MYKKLTQAALIMALSFVFLWLIITYLLPVSLPFLLGAALALLAEPAVRLLSERLKLRRSAATAIGVTAVFVLSAAVITLLISFLMRQLSHIVDLWPQLEQSLAQAVTAFRRWLLDLAPRMPESIHALIDHLAEDILSDSSALFSGLVSRLPQIATGLVGNLSEWLFGLLTGIISGYMISLRLTRLRQWFRSRLPERWRSQYLPAVTGLKKALGGWILAELKLAAIAFFLLLAGLSLLRVEHVLLLATLITLVDAFPVLGVGTVLVPWSIFRLIQDDYVLGLGLLALYAVIWLVRSILEPKLLGKELGLDPLVTLICIYAGFRLWGLGGMLLAPILAMAITQISKRIER